MPFIHWGRGVYDDPIKIAMWGGQLKLGPPCDSRGVITLTPLAPGV